MTVQVITQMKAGTETVEVGLELIRVSKNLERTADLATNIAEDVIFITQARVVKHHAADRTDQT
jgi:phosphate transport system protein